jgi:hypothetical protein
MALLQTTRLRSTLTAGLLAAAFAAAATPATAQRSPKSYGHYNQNATEFAGVCGDDACGPISLLNSFVFLQNTYGSLGDQLTGKDPVATAKKLAEYMKCGTTCGTGTTDFFIGKKAYLKDTVGAAIDSVMYIGPTFANLDKELGHKEDVEMFISYDKANGAADGGHYVTLYDLTRDKISFVDPGGVSGADGGAIDGALDETVGYNFDATKKRIFLKDYGGTPEGDTAKIDFAYAESPHTFEPEPQAWALMLLGFGALGAAARRRRAATA